MPDCFISYSSTDEEFAAYVHAELIRQGLNTFKASASIAPGERWSPGILTALRDSKWVILLASRAACQSVFVNQEIGAALIGSKKLVPIIWDIEPHELPGWASEYQALNLRGSDGYQPQQHISSIALRIQQSKNEGVVIAIALVAGLMYLANRD